jgi:hypothetical protein
MIVARHAESGIGTGAARAASITLLHSTFVHVVPLSQSVTSWREGSRRMGLLKLAIAYRAGKRRARRAAARDLEQLLDEANEVCVNCGYTRAQHDDAGSCPSY